MEVDPLSYTQRWTVRQYEVDSAGHVNNAVYLSYAEELAGRHAVALGFGPEWARRNHGSWVIRRNEITYHRPARYPDELELTVRVEMVRGARGHRRTTIIRPLDQTLIAEIFTEWVWVRDSDGRPAPVPRELLELAQPANDRYQRRSLEIARFDQGQS